MNRLEDNVTVLGNVIDRSSIGKRLSSDMDGSTGSKSRRSIIRIHKNNRTSGRLEREDIRCFIKFLSSQRRLKIDELDERIIRSIDLNISINRTNRNITTFRIDRISREGINAISRVASLATRGLRESGGNEGGGGSSNDGGESFRSGKGNVFLGGTIEGEGASGIDGNHIIRGVTRSNGDIVSIGEGNSGSMERGGTLVRVE